MTRILFGFLFPSLLGLTTAWGQTGRVAAPRLAADRTHQTETLEVVREVLSRAEFRDLDEDQWKLPRWILEWFDGFTSLVGNAFDALPSWLGAIIFAWLVLALIAIVAHLLYVLYTTFAPGRQQSGSKRNGKEKPTQILGIRDLEYQSVHDQAQEYLREKQWFEATKYLYVASILFLIDRDLLEYVQSKTNKQYLSDLSGHPHVAGHFSAMTRLFEPRVYGETDADETSCDEMNSILGRLADESP